VSLFAARGESRRGSATCYSSGLRPWLHALVRMRWLGLGRSSRLGDVSWMSTLMSRALPSAQRISSHCRAAKMLKVARYALESPWAGAGTRAGHRGEGVQPPGFRCGLKSCAGVSTQGMAAASRESRAHFIKIEHHLQTWGHVSPGMS